MTTEPLDLAQEIADRITELTGRRLPRPRTIRGLHGSVLNLPQKLFHRLAPCAVGIRRAARSTDQGRHDDAVAHLRQALAALTPRLAEEPPDLARQIRDRISELTGRQLPVPRRPSGLYHSVKAIPLNNLDEHLAATLKACRALLRPPQSSFEALGFTPPLEDVLALLTEKEQAQRGHRNAPPA